MQMKRLILELFCPGQSVIKDNINFQLSVPLSVKWQDFLTLVVFVWNKITKLRSSWTHLKVGLFSKHAFSISCLRTTSKKVRRFLFMSGHNPIFTWLWWFIHMKNVLFFKDISHFESPSHVLSLNSNKYFFLCCSLYYLPLKNLPVMFYLWTAISVSSSVALYIIYPSKKGKWFNWNFLLGFWCVKIWCPGVLFIPLPLFICAVRAGVCIT